MNASTATRLRLFLTCWLVFGLHFATNIVREHYPAFTLAEEGTLRVDAYAGFHSDIFEHTDGHHYINNNVAGSLVAAVPLVLASPVLDALGEAGRRRAASAPPDVEYETEYPNRRAFFRKVREHGLDLKFGAAAAVTSVFLMAPLSALFAVLAFAVLERRGVPPSRALWIAFLLAFATPVFYRAAFLNHNVMLALAAFASFLLLWRSADAADGAPRNGPLYWSGFLAASCVAFDYSGVVPCLCLTGYAGWTHMRRGARAALCAAVPFLLGAVAPTAFLLGSQASMFGNPFLPSQHWMAIGNELAERGARGFTAPDAELFLMNLVHPDWGLLAFSPLLVLAFLPAAGVAEDERVLPRRERIFVAVLTAAFLVFCSCNQFARLQWNTGFRYLMPLLPFLILVAADHLVRMRTSVLVAVSVPAVLHTWVLSMVRYTPSPTGRGSAVTESWRRFLAEGVQFPWLDVLRSTPSLRLRVLHAPWLPWALLLVLAALLFVVWRGAGRRSAARRAEP